MPLVFSTRSSSLALPSGLSACLSKSKNVSVANVTFSGAATGTGTGAGGGAAGAAAGGGAAAGAGAGGAGGGGAPSHRGSAVAGVQLESRQHSSLVPFFQTRSPLPLRQLSAPAWAKATGTARAAVANSTATLFRFFMILLSRKAAGLRETFNSDASEIRQTAPTIAVW